MSTITSVPQQREGVGSPVRPISVPPQGQQPVRQAARPARADQVQLQGQVNPYQGFADETARVTVDRWRKGPNDSIERILLNQGYSQQDIYRKDSQGRTLIQRVAEANGLKDPNLIRPGRPGLIVPVKAKKPEAQPQAQPQTQPEVKPEVQTQPQAQPEVKPEPQPQTRPDLKPEPQTQTQPQPQPEVKPENHPQPQTQTQPEVKPEEVPAENKPAEAQEPERRGRRRFWLFGPRIKPKPRQEEPQNEPTGQAQPEQPVTPVQMTPEEQRELAEKENAEVGLLLDGVKQQKFTRPEFQALNATANQYTELRAQYAKEGFKPEQMRELAQVQQQYGAMYQRFLADDKAKVTFSGGGRNAAARFRNQQNEEGGELYDQFTAQQIDEATIRARLLAQRNNASNLGVNPPR